MMPDSECEFPIAPPRRRKKTKSVDHGVVDSLTSATEDGNAERCDSEVPRAPPRRRRKSRDSRSSVVSDRESESNPLDTTPDTAEQNPATSSSSSSSSPSSSCYLIQTNQTAAPAVANPANGWRVDSEQTDKENQWTSNYSRPQFRLSSSPCVVRNKQLYHINRFHPRTTTQLHSATSPTRGKDALFESSNTSDNWPRPTDENDCKLNKQKKQFANSNNNNVDVGDGGDDNDGDDIFASWKKQKNVGDFRRHVVNTNRQRYQNGSTTSYHTIVFEPIKMPETSTYSKPLFHDTTNQPESIDQKIMLDTEAKCNSASDDDEHEDAFETLKTNNGDSRPLQSVSNENTHVDRTSPSTFHTNCSSEPVRFPESLRPCADSPPLSAELTDAGDAAINTPESADENREVDDAASVSMMEEPPPDYSNDNDDDDDDDDNIFPSLRKNSEYMHPVVNECWPNGLGNNWSADGYRQNPRYQSANMVADNDFQTTSSIFASECDADDVFTLNGNEKRNGDRPSGNDSRCWWPAERRRTTGERTWSENDLETRCADLLAWQRQQRLQRQQRNLYLANRLPRQPHADNLTEKVFECGRKNEDTQSSYSNRSTFLTSAESNRKLAANDSRTILEIKCGVDDESPTIGDKNHQTGFARADYYKSASTNRCGAKLPREINNENDKDMSETVRQSGVDDDANRDRLAACRMTLLENFTLSNDYSTTCPSSSIIHRPQTAAWTSLSVEVAANSTSTNVPGRTKSHDATNALSQPNVHSRCTDNGQPGSASCGTAGKDFAVKPIFRSEPKSSLATTSPANSHGICVQFQLPRVEQSVWNSDQRTSHETASGGLYDAVWKDSKSGTLTICREENCITDSSVSDVKDNLLTVRNPAACNGDYVQHPADEVYHDNVDIKHGTVEHGAGNHCSAVSSLLSRAVSCDTDAEVSASFTMLPQDSVCTDEQHPDGEVQDSGWRQNVCSTNGPWSTDGRSTEVETKSPSASVGGRGSTSWSLGSFYVDGGSRMKGLRIPRTSSSTSSAVVRPCLDLPLIAGGVTARRRIGSDSASVLPATLLPRPFMPRSCYRSVRPAFTSSSSTGANNHDGERHLTNVAGSRPSPVISSGSGSTSVENAAEKPFTANCSVSSFRGQPDDRGEIRPVYLTSSSLMEVPQPQTNGGGESKYTLGATRSEKPISTMLHLRQPLSSKVADSKGFLTATDSPGLNTFEESNSTIDNRKSVLVGFAVPCSRQRPDIGNEFREEMDPKSSEVVYTSPSLTTHDESLQMNDCYSDNVGSQPPAVGRVVGPSTMPKSVLAQPAPCAVRFTDPLPPPSMLYHSTTHRDGDDDDAASSFIVESADLGRTTPDGDNDSDTLQTLASPSLHRSTTSCEPRVKSMAAESAFVQDSCSSQNDQFDDAVEDKTTTRKKTINDEVANERQEIDDETREARTVAKTKKTLRTSGSEFARDNAINRGRNDERHSSAEHEATLSVSTEFAVEDRRKLRETKQTNTRTELTRHTNHDEWEEDVTKDVNGLSDQPGTEMISLEKGVFGLGFCIEGGRDCPTGRAPVTVKRLFRGDVAARYVLSPGDEIVCVNGKQFANMSLYEAWNYLKALPDGRVSLVVRRHNKSPPVLSL